MGHHVLTNFDQLLKNLGFISVLCKKKNNYRVNQYFQFQWQPCSPPRVDCTRWRAVGQFWYCRDQALQSLEILHYKVGLCGCEECPRDKRHTSFHLTGAIKLSNFQKFIFVNIHFSIFLITTGNNCKRIRIR